MFTNGNFALKIVVPLRYCNYKHWLLFVCFCLFVFGLLDLNSSIVINLWLLVTSSVAHRTSYVTHLSLRGQPKQTEDRDNLCFKSLVRFLLLLSIFLTLFIGEA
jgi:hypothetical protein